jgi:aerobic-type carbon monoxide dehydrogenase small subunit (CoxS/CutS family)
VEGLARNGVLHPLQRAFMAHHGLQCGFCTPGFLMLTASALEKNPHIQDDELTDLLSSNLCRCTGYQGIVKAVRAARDEMRPPVPEVIEASPAEIDPSHETAEEAKPAAPEMLEPI